MDFGPSAGTNPLDLAAANQQASLEGLTAKRELILIDGAVPDYQALVAGISTSADVFVLDPTQDGIAQIGEILSDYSGLEAIQIFSHGEAGSLQLGSATVNAKNLTQYREALRTWSKALAEDADLLFFGCNLAATADGQLLVDQLASLTGADVAASDDLTGHASLGGDWDLEIAFGPIEASIALDEATQNHYGFTLAITPSINITSKLISFSGDTSDNQLSIQFNDEGLFAYSFDGTNFLTNLSGQTLSSSVFLSDSYGINVNLGGGNDTLSVDASLTELLDNANATTTWTVTGQGTGTIDAGDKTSAVTFIEVENLVGGTSKDTFSVSNPSHVTSIDGGGDTDTLDLSNSSTANTWTISGEGTGSVSASPGTVQFSAITDIAGSNTAKDTFVVETAGTISGTIDGGSSTDDGVSYSTFDGPVEVNLGLASATGIGEFIGIESFAGSTVDPAGSAKLDVAQKPTQVEVGDRIKVGNQYYDAIAAIEPDGGLGYNYDATTDKPPAIAIGNRVKAANGKLYQAIAANRPASGTVDLSTETFTNLTKWIEIIVDLSEETQDYANNPNWLEVTNFVVGEDAIATTWNISSNNAFSVNGLGFSNFGNILAGRGDDTFNFADGASLSGVIDGGIGAYFDFSVESSPDEPLTAGDRVILENGTIYQVAAGQTIGFAAGTGANHTITATPASIAVGDRVAVGNKLYQAVEAIQPVAPATTVNLSEEVQLYASNEVWQPVTIDLSTTSQNYATNSQWTPVTIAGDILNFENSPSPISVGLETDTVSNASGALTQFANIEAIVGSGQTTDKIIGSSNDTTWSITGANQGRVDGIRFSAFENLTGSAAGNDWFIFENANSSLSGTIDGGIGKADSFAVRNPDSGVLQVFDVGPANGDANGDGTADQENPDADQSATNVSFGGINGINYANLNDYKPFIVEDDTLKIQGTGGDDAIVLSVEGNTLKIVKNGSEVVGDVGAISGINTIQINLGGGNDTLTFQTGELTFAQAITVDGGDGRDIVNIAQNLKLNGKTLSITAENITINSGVVVETTSTSGVGNISLKGETVTVGSGAVLDARAATNAVSDGNITISASIAEFIDPTNNLFFNLDTNQVGVKIGAGAAIYRYYGCDYRYFDSPGHLQAGQELCDYTSGQKGFKLCQSRVTP
jgi:hypothetical protein